MAQSAGADRPVAPMMAVTSVMRVQQILLARLQRDARAVRADVRALRGSDAAALQPRRARSRWARWALGSRSTRPASPTWSMGWSSWATRAASRTPATGARRWPRSPSAGREVAVAATEAMHAISFGTLPLHRAELERADRAAAPGARRRGRLRGAGRLTLLGRAINSLTSDYRID